MDMQISAFKSPNGNKDIHPKVSLWLLSGSKSLGSTSYDLGWGSESHKSSICLRSTYNELLNKQLEINLKDSGMLLSSTLSWKILNFRSIMINSLIWTELLIENEND